jgi:hypothetical protein
MFCLFEISFHYYFSNSKKRLKCPNPKDSKLINNSPSWYTLGIFGKHWIGGASTLFKTVWSYSVKAINY